MSRMATCSTERWMVGRCRLASVSALVGGKLSSMASTDRTVHVGQRTYALLRAEAERRHRDVDTTADDLLAERLLAAAINTTRLQGTLERAARLRARLPRTEQAVSLVREGREELEGRTERQ
jgi:hypothetical protein